MVVLMGWGLKIGYDLWKYDAMMSFYVSRIWGELHLLSEELVVV